MGTLVLKVEFPISPDQLFLINAIIFRQHKSTRNKLFLEEYENISYIKKRSSCNICMVDKNKFKKLKCKHLFCNDCIKEWLLKHANTCPNCRLVLN